MNIISRWETKYEMDAASALRLRQAVARVLPLFEYTKGHPFTHVTTVYFDTDRLDFYKRATASHDDNVKIRVREYIYKEEDGRLRLLPYCYLEIKRRTGGYVTKRRLRLPKHLLDPLLEGKNIWEELVASDPEADTEQNREIYWELREVLQLYHVLPRSIVQYRRYVYQEDEWKLRITFDDELIVYSPERTLYVRSETLNPDESSPNCRRLEKVIMEIKCPGSYPDWLNKALGDFLPRKISKFTESISILVD